MIHDPSIDLAAVLRNELAGDAIWRIASGVGTPMPSVQTAASGVAAVMVAALATKAATPQGLDDLIDLMRTSGFDGGRSELLPGRPALLDLATRGLAMTTHLLGGRRASVVNWVASMTGFDRRSAAALLAVAAPFALHVVGRQARRSGGLTGPVLANLLRSQIGLLRETAPQALASVGGGIDLQGPVVKPGVPSAPTSTRAPRRWLCWSASRPRSPWHESY